MAKGFFYIFAIKTNNTMDLRLEDLDGSVFMYNPKKDSELKRLLDVHSDFNFPLYSGIKTLRYQILRYIVLQYDKNTPLRHHFPNYYKRKMQAAIMAGFQRNSKTGRFSESVKDILIGENEDINKAIIRYVMMFYDDDYLMLIIYRELLGGQSADMMKMKNSKPLSNSNIQAIREMNQEIKQLAEKIFGGKENRKLEEELYRSLEYEIEALRPDYVAKQLSKGEKLFTNALADDESIE